MDTVAPPITCDWLRELAAGYLRGFKSFPEQTEERWGFCFVRKRARQEAGFFVGFLTEEPSREKDEASTYDPPECVVGAFVRPARSALHRKLVGAKESLFRVSYQRAMKYTSRRPRWELREREELALARRAPLTAFPADDREKYARNFFIESLAVLVRTGLPAALRATGDW
ncbi:MAG: hypothetical protein L0212_02320 [Acidobacteria bacterium]|nr:hypothetical protein [Acidobacteriota bacterium]